MNSNSIQVVHCKKEKETEYFYIGRPTILGNPFTHKEGTNAEHIVESREKAVEAYRVYILERIKAKDKEVLAEFRRLKHEYLKNNRQLKLACWCHPEACHGDVVKEILEQAMKEMEKRIDKNTFIYSAVERFKYRQTLPNGIIEFVDIKLGTKGMWSRNSFKKDIEGMPIFEHDEVEFLLPSKNNEIIYGIVLYYEKEDKWVIKTDNSYFPLEKFLLLNKSLLSQPLL